MATKSLDTDQQISIQALIRSWEGKLTWDLLVTKIESSLAITTTRQTLDKYLNTKIENAHSRGNLFPLTILIYLSIYKKILI